MYEGHTVGVVVPAYNESGFVGEVIETLPAFVDRAYVIDDRSTDGTWAEIERAAAAVNERAAPERLPALHADGGRTRAEGRPAHANTGRTQADGGPAHAEGGPANAEGGPAHADGGPAHADSGRTQTGGGSAHAESGRTQTGGGSAHADSGRTQADDRTYPDGGGTFDPRVVPIRHEENRGVGGAIKTGYQRAREDGLDVVAVMNGDGQMDPAILDRIVDPVVAGRADYAKGNRLSNADDRAEMPAWRLFGNGVLTFLTKCVSGYWRMSDPQNGYTAISGRALELIDLDRLYEDYGFCNDLLVHCNVHGMRVEDVPMRSRYGDERSHIRYSTFVPSLSWLLARRAAWRYKQKYVVSDFHPLVFLLVLGLLGGGAGLAFTGWFVATAGAATVETLVSLVVVLLGACFVALAMVFDRLANEPLEAGVYDRVGGEGP
ncbi:glycosyltransferase family 2 protein [Halovivax sp.]|uniref:glycosyltransferase family 2 protein n=1 Tax=Halovivax sp. TaxID=1935978 RepID=UPI0025C432F3|nr:glycosyltransferase [Halovivax sp.]